MIDQQSGEIDTLVHAWVAALRVGARVAVEGTLTLRRVELGSGEVLGRADSCALVKLNGNPPALPFEAARGEWREGRPGEGLAALLAIPEGEEFDPWGYPEIRQAFRLDFSPSETELRSFVRALEAGAAAREKAGRVAVAMFFGDLATVPKFARQNLPGEVFLPASYREALAKFGLWDLVFLWETECRNRGKLELLDKRKKELASPERCQEIYRQGGHVVYRSGEDASIFYLASDVLLSLPRFPIIALTQRAEKPTCALIIAGRLVKLAAEGLTHVLSIYDFADDAQIENKNLEGMVIASCLARAFVLEVEMLISKRNRTDRTRLTSSDLAAPGTLPTVELLIERARRSMQAPETYLPDSWSLT